MRATLAPDSAVLRHAARVAVLVAGSDLVVRLAGIDRGYWVSLTVLVVLRPDFSATLQRSVMRTAGTIVGLLIASELVRVLPGGGWWQVGLIAALAFAMRLAGPGNVALSAVALSGLVVVLLEINGVPAAQTVLDRALATLSGGALAVVASLALPAWERQYLPGRLGALLEAYRDYLLAVADLDADRATMQRARAAARLARTNAQASLDRAQAEPVAAQAEIELGRGGARAHAPVRARRAGRGRPAGPDARCRRAARAGRVPHRSRRRPWPSPGRWCCVTPSRPRADRCVRCRSSWPSRCRPTRPAPEGSESALTLVDATDRITNSLDTLLDELRRQARQAA